MIATGLSVLFPDSTENVVTVFDNIMSGNIGGVLFVIAFAPAVCEEMLFRGLILQSMKEKYRVPAAIGITALLFGIYHMSLVKLIPTGLLGLVLCCMAYRADSIYPAMLIHFLNNAFSVVISRGPEKLKDLLPVFYQETLGFGDVMLLLCVGLILMGIGLFFLEKGRPGRKIKRKADRA